MVWALSHQRRGCLAMSYSQDKKVQRKRPTITITMSDAVLAEVDEMKEKLGTTRANVMERCIIYGMPVFKKQYDKKEEKPVQNENKMDDIGEKYTRNLIMNVDSDEGWTAV